jgi:two-component system chemotaxis sensor kinase CheA
MPRAMGTSKRVVPEVRQRRIQPVSDSNDFPLIIDDSAEAGGGADAGAMAIYTQELGETATNLEKTLIELEKESGNTEKVNTAFRLFHNLKGSSAMMGLLVLKEVCHYAEGLLDKIRSGACALESAHIDLFMEALGAIRELGDRLAHEGGEGKERYFLLLHKLDEAAKAASGGAGEGKDEGSARKEEGGHEHTRKEGDEIIKISRDNIDVLMLLVGEYISLKNRALWLKRKYSSDRQYIDLTHELEAFAQKLQRNVLKLRLSSVEPVFDSMRRVVRTTTQQLGKKIDFEILGADTLLDRSILDVIAEPLMHMIRNSIDHGVEHPDVRVERNKPESGRLVLKADYRGGEVHVSITDDGGGIDPQRILRRAQNMQLVSEAQAASLTRQEIIQLIFLPGFSSVEKVTETSGRGVGMDVVRSTIQSVGGEIDIQTEVGIGTTITLRLPLSMSIVDSLSFEIAGQAYAVPQVNVEEVYSLHAFEVRESLTALPGGAKSLTVRGVPLPVVSLADILGTREPRPESLLQLRQGKKRFVVEAGRILGPTSILSQPLPSSFAHDAPFAGITTRGDGSLLFQLDVEKISRSVAAHSTTRGKKRPTGENRGTAGTQAEGSLMSSSDVRRLQQKIITFSCGQHFCIPVQRAKRIVFLTDRQINTIGDGRSHYVTIENETIRLLWVEKLLLAQSPIRTSTYSLVLFQHEGTTYAIPTSDFHGIKRMPEIYDTTLAEPGIQGSTVIEGETILLLDLPALVRIELGEPLEVSSKVPATAGAARRTYRVLAAEDDTFFASELMATLRGQGIDVTLCEDGLLAKNALSDPSFAQSLDAVVTDLEMPNMTGLALIRWMKSSPHASQLPVVAYTAITTAEMKNKVMQAGALDFISKMSFDPLLKRLTSIFTGQPMVTAADSKGPSSEDLVQRLVSVWLGEQVFAMPMNNIKEVSPVTPSARVPGVPHWCDKVTFFRGHSIPVLHLSRYFELPYDPQGTAEQAVVEVAGRVFAIIIDRVGEVLVESALTAGEGYPSHTAGQRNMAHMVKQVYRRESGKESDLILLLDGQRLADVIFKEHASATEERAA